MKPEIVFNRRLNTYFLRCPYCGKLFTKNKDYVKHLMKSHKNRLTKENK